nr:LysR family transcriptional regulator [Maliibacterium massiliense]
MTLRHMRIFVAVCDHGGVTKAAEALYMAQPSVSLAIRELEQYYGARFFDRISRRLYLTQAGQQMLGYARHITSLFDEMERSMRTSFEQGALRIACTVTIGTCLMPNLARAFGTQYPQMRLEVRVDNAETVERQVLANDVDLGLSEGIPHAQALVSAPFMDDTLVLVCAGAHPFAHRKQVSARELAQQDVLLRESGSGTRELFDSAMLTLGVEIHPLWQCTSTQAIVRAVEANLGVSVLPRRMVQQDIARGRVVAVPLRDVAFSRKFYILHHRSKYLSQSMQAFIALCREQAL